MTELCVYIYQGQAVCQVARHLDNVTIFGTASYNKHEALKNQVDHVYDHVVDYCQEIKKLDHNLFLFFLLFPSSLDVKCRLVTGRIHEYCLILNDGFLSKYIKNVHDVD